MWDATDILGWGDGEREKTREVRTEGPVFRMKQARASQSKVIKYAYSTSQRRLFIAGNHIFLFLYYHTKKVTILLENTARRLPLICRNLH